MNITELKNYAFTIQVPGFKKVSYEGQYITYKDLSNIQQEDYLYRLVRSSLSDNEHQHFEIKFELHKDGRTHCHGTVYQLTEALLNEFKESICFQIGVKTPKQKTDVCFCIPILYSLGWEMYCNKEQDEEDRYSKYLFKGKK